MSIDQIAKLLRTCYYIMNKCALHPHSVHYSIPVLHISDRFCDSSKFLLSCTYYQYLRQIAASLLSAQAAHRWDVWSSPTQDTHGLRLAKQVLSECGIPLISSDHLLQPTFG